MKEQKQILKIYQSRIYSASVVVNVLDSHIVVSELELYSRYCIHFRTNALRKGMNPYRAVILL